jgi:hypothetical protein
MPVIPKRNHPPSTRIQIIINTTKQNIMGRKTTAVDLAKRNNPLGMPNYNIIDHRL